MTGSQAFHDDVSRAIRGTSAGRKLTSAQVLAVGDAAAIAVADYRIRRRHRTDVPLDGAQAFAEKLSKTLGALVALIERRAKAVSRLALDGRTRQILTGPDGTTGFAVAALSWHRTLSSWHAKAQRESARLALPNHRPVDWDRLRLSCAVADALAGVAIKPSRYDRGTFVALLEVVYATVGIDDAGAVAGAKAAIDALPTWRAIPEHLRPPKAIAGEK